MHIIPSIGLLTGAVAVFAATAAEARIECRDGYQISGGREISTPYCNDELVAQVAREHGDRVSASEVRNNPSRKHEICRWVGNDIRIEQYCPDEGSSDRDR